MDKLADLREGVNYVIDAMRAIIDSARRRASSDPTTEGLLPLVQRAVLVRQYECLEHAIPKAGASRNRVMG